MKLNCQHLLAGLWAAALTLCVISIGLRLSDGSPFDTSILALLPQDEQSVDIAAANEVMSAHFSNRILLLVGTDRGSDEQLLDITRQLTRQLQSSNQFTQIDNGLRPEQQQQLARFYQPYRYQLLTPSIRTALQRQQYQQLKSQALARLYSPAAPSRATTVIDDPFGLLDAWLQHLQPGGGFSADTWGLKASDGDTRYRVISATFTGSAYDLDNQQRLLPVIDGLDSRLHSSREHELAGYTMLRSGLIFHAAAGARQARGEIATIGAGSAALVIALLIWHFRRPAPLLLPLLSIGAGLLIALTASLWIFERIHVVTLAFGASLVGVSIDYALHYLCASRSRSADTLREILPGISLGLATSVLAYSAQALTPFPGLQQMAVFSAAGLAGAWLTVVCWFPLLYRETHTDPSILSGWLRRLHNRRRLLISALVATALLAAAGWAQIQFSDKLANLQSSPPALLQDEQKIQALSRQAGGGRYLLISTADAESNLQIQEALRTPLDQLVEHGSLQSYLALSQFLPSRARQQRDHELIKSHLYQSPQLLDDFYATLGAPAMADNARQAFQPQPQWLTPDEWQNFPLARQFPYLWISDTSAQRQKVISVISLGGVQNAGVYTQLNALAHGNAGVQFVDRVSSTSDLLARYRNTVSQWVLLAYLGVALVLGWRFGRAAVGVLTPPLVATALTFGLLMVFDQALNLFNILAALLILGIGLDTGIFLRESRGAAHCWQAVTLSSLTSVFSFGLLSLSKTPVLHHFGITVLLGITLTWLLVFLSAFGTLDSGRSEFDNHQGREGQ